jgi:hypothetical protein
VTTEPTATPETTATPGVDRGRLAWLLAGGLALVGGTLLGWSGAFLEALATPPALVRAALVAGAVVLGLWLLNQALRRLAASQGPGAGELSGRDLAGLVRGVRLVFLSVAAFAAAGGWLVGHPLPFIVALVIAGVDILETSFLLLVIALRRD